MNKEQTIQVKNEGRLAMKWTMLLCLLCLGCSDGRAPTDGTELLQARTGEYTDGQRIEVISWALKNNAVTQGGTPLFRVFDFCPTGGYEYCIAYTCNEANPLYQYGPVFFGSHTSFKACLDAMVDEWGTQGNGELQDTGRVQWLADGHDACQDYIQMHWAYVDPDSFCISFDWWNDQTEPPGWESYFSREASPRDAIDAGVAVTKW